MNIKIRKIFTLESGHNLEFHKLSKATPGFTHRVSIDGVAVDWLKVGFAPNKKAAQFYFEKHKIS